MGANLVRIRPSGTDCETYLGVGHLHRREGTISKIDALTRQIKRAKKKAGSTMCANCSCKGSGCSKRWISHGYAPRTAHKCALIGQRLLWSPSHLATSIRISGT